ncbi:MAG: T9SS type A sorting domain-containing protein [Salinivirgaceae bacterium]|nr:T9SS type A sorting domain-containing protein [Salinivirgaceae bacterium]
MKTRHIIPILLALVLVPTLSAWAKTISGTETQSNTQTLNENLTINGTYTINGDLTVKGNVTVNGNGTLIINGSLYVTGSFTGDYRILPRSYSNVTVNGNLIVEKKLTADGNITVNGDMTANSMDANHSISIGDNASITIDNKLTGNTNITVNGQLQAGSVENNYPLTISKNATMTISGKLLGDDNITVNGHLEAGEAEINENLTIGSDAMMIVSNLLTDDGDITVNGKLEAGEIIVNNNLTVNSDAVLFVNKDESDSNPNGKLTVNSDGHLKLQPNSTCIIEGNLKQDGTVSILKALFSLLNETAETGDIEASCAMLVVCGDYEIYSTPLLNNSDMDAEYINPDENEIYVFGNNELSKVGISQNSLKNRADFEESFGNYSKFLDDVLPIELVYFTAHEIGYGVRFEWETASELNNDFFTIEFSIDAVEFAELTNIDGAGTSTEPHNYRYTDFSSHAGIIYYRLKQTDYDGNFSYSEIVPVVFAEHHEAETNDINFVVYPNPATDYITISGGEYESISFVSTNGAVLKREAAQNTHSITNLPKGVNIVIIHTATGDVSLRVIKR